MKNALFRPPALVLFTGLALLAALSLCHSAQGADHFFFTNITDKSLAIYEGRLPVLVYNHGVIHRAGVPTDRARSTYIHPLYGLDGEVLTDDFPKDHYHHRGLLWAWPHVRFGDKQYDLWMLNGIEQRFVRWTERNTERNQAVLGIENGWFVGEKKMVREEVRLRFIPSTQDGRAIDLEFTWTPLHEPLTLQGAEGKSYGGLTLRFAPRTNTVITTPLGQGKEDLTVTRLPWADLSARFTGKTEISGAGIFVAPDHPDFPPEWLTRHYGVLCLGWPGVNPAVLQVGEGVHCRYRVWIHRGAADGESLARKHEEWATSLRDAKK